MRNVVIAMFVSVDGYIEGPGRTMVPPPYSADLQKHWIDRNMTRTDVMAYGRVAYEGMARFWTSPAAPADQARQLAAMDKIVFSRTLDSADWGRVRIVRDDVAGELDRLKQAPGKDIVLIGGGGTATSLIQLGVVDELCLLVNPILLGGGTRLFQGEFAQQRLALTEALPFDTGVVRLTYKRA